MKKPLHVVLPCFLAIVAAAATAAQPARAAVGPDPQLYQETVQQGVDFLRRSQDENGAYAPQTGIGVTALVTTALMRHGRSPQDPLIAKSLQYLEGFVRESGGIHVEDTNHRNYETCLTVLCFEEANTDGRYDKIIANAEAFLKNLQWDGDEGHDKSSTSYGGAGYGGHKRPDLSNTSFLIEALKAAGTDAKDEAMQKALVFVSRCQNLETEHNTTKFAAKNPDGGFYYTPAAGGTSQAGETPDGGLRSYGSMTYAGLKSMIYAGVGPEDPRVKAAYNWVKKHYALESNPGMGNAGLYYYYHTFAKALAAIGKDVIVDADGEQHDWRAEITRELAERQQEDGSWLNKNTRWLEGDPELVTGYALLALSYCRPEQEQK